MPGELKRTAPNDAHLAFRNDALELLRRHAGATDPTHLLAIASHMVGQIIAMLDQRAISPDMAMHIVMTNIEAGNAEVISQLTGTMGRA